ncbi:MAG: hypothetical protein AB2665_19640 [Candidatus Thiodiazotropha sp.]|nr:hypothetical protein [Candidatus Thiodiazotropha taylori]
MYYKWLGLFTASVIDSEFIGSVMRFPQLKIGQQFEYQGKRYTKTGPMTAAEEGTGASTMIRRSAEVALVDGVASSMSDKQYKQNYSRDEVVGFFERYRAELIVQSQKSANADSAIQLNQLLTMLNDRALYESLL